MVRALTVLSPLMVTSRRLLLCVLDHLLWYLFMDTCAGPDVGAGTGKGKGKVVVVLWQDLGLAHLCLPTHGCRTHWALTRTSSPLRNQFKERFVLVFCTWNVRSPPPQSGQHQIAPGTLSVLACRFLRIPLNNSRGANTFLTDGIGCSPGGALWRDVAGLVLNQTWRIGVEPQLSRLQTVPWPIPNWKREEKGQILKKKKNLARKTLQAQPRHRDRSIIQHGGNSGGFIPSAPLTPIQYSRLARGRQELQESSLMS